MSSTLTWAKAGPQTKTGTAVGDCFTDLKSLIDSKSGDASFPWEVSASNLASTPYYVALKPKSGANGRILVVCWTSAPAGNNAAILDTAPTSNVVFVAWFPNGNVNTPSNLTAASGTIFGDDTDCVKVCPISTIATMYAANFQWSWFANAEGCLFQTGVTTSGSAYYGAAAGKILVDGADNEYGGVASLSYASATTITESTTYPTTLINAGSNTATVRTNYGGTPNRVGGCAWRPSVAGMLTQSWGSVSDPTVNTTLNLLWLFAIPVLFYGSTKLGPALKLRQMALGPPSTSSFTNISITGPTVVALGTNPSTTSNAANLYLTQFKI